MHADERIPHRQKTACWMQLHQLFKFFLPAFRRFFRFSVFIIETEDFKTPSRSEETTRHTDKTVAW